MRRKTALRLVKEELDRATVQYGEFSSAHEGYAVLLEEVEELWDEIKAGNGATHRATSEAVQIAAMAVRYLMDLCEEEKAVEHERKVRSYVPYPVGGNYRHESGGYSG